MHILIADHYRNTAACLAELLKGVAPHSNTTAVAVDGLQAVDLAQKQPPDVAVLDLGLPNVDGLTAGQRIRDLFGNRVLLVATSVRGEELQVARSSGRFDHALQKPVDVDQLLGIIGASAGVGQRSAT